MFKKSFFAVFALFILFCSGINASEVQESTLHVESATQNDVAPDTVKIRFYVENSGINLSDLKDKNDKIVNSAIVKIKEKLSANDSIKTIALSVNSVYNYKDKIRIFQKYEVKNGFEVKLKNLNIISEIIKLAVDNGVNRVDGLAFSLEDSETHCNELITQAVKKARLKAQITANAADSQILKVKNLNPYCSVSGNTPRPRYYMNATMAKDSLAGETSAIETIEPGSINIRAGVNITYYLK